MNYILAEPQVQVSCNCVCLFICEFLGTLFVSVLILLGTFGLIFFYKFIFDISSLISPIHMERLYVIIRGMQGCPIFPFSPLKNKHFWPLQKQTLICIMSKNSQNSVVNFLEKCVLHIWYKSVNFVPKETKHIHSNSKFL